MNILPNVSVAPTNTRSIIYILLLCTAIYFSSFASAQNIDVSISTSGGTDPGDTVTVTFTLTCNDPLAARPCRMGNFAPGSGNITVSGAVSQVFNLSRLGQFTSGQSKTRIRTFTVAGNQGDVITINASYEGYCRSDDSNGPAPPDTAEINCSDTADPINFVVTPVTLSQFDSSRSGNYIDVDWGTSSELFNVGFQLWGFDSVSQTWHPLHNRLIKSGSGNAVEPQSYSKTTSIPSKIESLTALGISSVDTDGTEHYYGPFDLGQSYGELGAFESISWDHIRSELDINMAQMGYVKNRAHGYLKVYTEQTTAAALSIEETLVAEFSIDADGLYRINTQALLNIGIDWREIEKRDIAVIDSNGDGIVRFVKTDGEGSQPNQPLGENGEIYFYGQAPDEQAGIYTDSSVYRLVIDRSKVLEAQKQGKKGITSGLSEFYINHEVIENDALYILSSEADDPWLSHVFVSYADQPNLHGVTMPVEDDALWNQPSRITMSLGKSSDLIGSGDEHVVQGVTLSPEGENGLLYLDTQTSNNTGLWDVSFDLPANTPLTLNTNGDPIVGAAFSAGEGYAFSEIQVDSVGLSYARPYKAKSDDDFLHFQAPNTGELGYQVRIPKGGKVKVFATDGSNLVKLNPETKSIIADGDGVEFNMITVATLQGLSDTDQPIHYWVSNEAGFLSVEGLSLKSIATPANLLSQAADSNYLIISHPSFMDENAASPLNSYAAHKLNQGYSVSIINYFDIVDTYGGGQVGPAALSIFLRTIEESYGQLEHVLLVGGSTYDHTNIQQTGAVTFIPGHYGQSSYSHYTVSDAPYITDSEGSAFASIGRWPVRSMGDLQVIIDKTIAWDTSDHSSGSALLIAEHTVEGENIDFGSALDIVATNLPQDYAQTKVYVDQIMIENPELSLTQALSQAKGEIINQLNTTPDVVLYSGHASTRQLSNQNLFKSGDINQVTSSGGEIWLPMSCYVTFYESTHVNTLAHQLLFSGNAVNITGAMLLSNQGQNIQMGASILDNTMNYGASIGEAVNTAKAVQNDANLNINWAILGDPTSTIGAQ